MIEIINSSSFDYNNINPNFIYNRMDLFANLFVILHIKNSNKEFYIEVKIEKKEALLGSWMMEISRSELKEISTFIFKHYEYVSVISFFFTITEDNFKLTKHYHVCLPKTYNELLSREPSNGRYNIKRKNKVARDFGRLDLIEYDGSIPQNIINQYFHLKKVTHNVDYSMPWEEYINKYHVTNAYVVFFGEEIGAIMLSCEQCPIVNLENFTFDTKFAKYSPGRIVYDMVLERLISKGKTIVYLGGGDYDYKKKYNSIINFTHEGKLYKSILIHIYNDIISFYNKHLLWRYKALK